MKQGQLYILGYMERGGRGGGGKFLFGIVTPSLSIITGKRLVGRGKDIMEKSWEW